MRNLTKNLKDSLKFLVSCFQRAVSMSEGLLFIKCITDEQQGAKEGVS